MFPPLAPAPPPALPPVAFLFNLGGPELMLILLVGVLIFGSRLPEVGRKVGRTVSQLRQGMAEFQRHLDADDDIGEARRSMQQLGSEIKGVRREAMDATREIPGAVARVKTAAREEIGGDPPAVEESAPAESDRDRIGDGEAAPGTDAAGPGAADAEPPSGSPQQGRDR